MARSKKLIASSVYTQQKAPPVGPEVGPSGTTNAGGQLLVEDNNKLLHQQAFGAPGTQTWGEWQKAASTDPHVAMALDFVCGPIRDAAWDIEPDENNPDSKRQAEFLEWNLSEVLEPGFDEVKFQAASGALTYGFSLFERVIDKRPVPLIKGIGDAYALTKLAERLPSSVHPNGWLEGPSLELEQIRQMAMRNDGSYTWADVLLPAEKTLLFSWQRKANNYQGVSAFRPVWYYVQIRAFLAKLIGIGSQREAGGIPIATIPDPSTPLSEGQRKDLQLFLANATLHEAASGVMPPGVKLEWFFSPGANKGHVVEMWEKLGLVILQLLQAQQMILGTGSTGSRAVGQVHAAASLKYVQSVVAMVEAVFNGVGRRGYTGVLRQLIDLNFGPQPLGYPKLRLTLKKPEMDPLERAQAMQAAVNAGVLTVTIDDENVMREDLGLSPIDDETRDAEKAKKSALAPPAMIKPGTPPTPGSPPSENSDPDEQREEAHAHGARLTGAAYVPSRPLRDSEKHLAVAEMSAYLDGARHRFEREARPAIVEMLVRAQRAITAAMEDGNPNEVAALPLNTTRLEKVVRDFLAELRAEGGRQVRGEMARAKATKKVVAAAGDESADEEDPIVADTDELIDAQSHALVRRMTSRLKSELETEAIDASRTNADASEVVSRTVAKQLDTAAFRTDAGSVITRAFNLGRDEAARLIGASSVEYSAVMDSNTCSPCAQLDGTTAAIDSPEHDALLPPNRDCDGGGNCRCVLVYVPDASGGAEEDDAE